MLPVIVGVAVEKAVNKMELDFSGVMPSVVNALIIFLIVAVTVPLAKWLLTKYPVPGLSALVMSI